MCGYLIYQTEKKLKKSKVKKIEKSLAHRGLGSSIHNEDGAFVIHNMLPMCNLVPGIYQQPLINPYRWPKLIGAFTGEIFNWKILKTKLILQ